MEIHHNMSLTYFMLPCLQACVCVNRSSTHLHLQSHTLLDLRAINVFISIWERPVTILKWSKVIFYSLG